MNAEPESIELHVIAPDGSDRVVAVTQSPFCIGRAFHNDLPLIDPQISRHHACLRLEGGRIQLVDMGSENGTWIDGTRLEANQPYVLDYHETFRIGAYQLRPEPMAGAPLPHRSEEETVPIAATAFEATGVHATAGHSGSPLEPLIESGPGGGLGVLLKTPEISVTPGASTNVSLVVINQDHGTDRFRITLSGIPDQWLPAPPPLIELPSNARQEVNLTVAPPRSPESRVGRYRPVIQVASQNVPTETVEVHPTLTVAPYSAFASTLNPPRIGANETAQVVVRNDGNAQQTFTVAWLDSEDRYEFRPPETQMTLAAGQTAAVAFRVVPRRQRWFGGSRIDVYSAKITPEKGLPQAHTGQIVTAGIIPPWAAALLLVLLLCAIGSAAAAFALIGAAPTGTPTGTPTVTGTAAPTITPLPTNTTLPPATPIPPTPIPPTPIPPTPIPTSAPLPTYTPLPTNTPYPTNTPFPTAAPLPTSTPLPTSPPLPTSTPLAPTVTPTPNITDWRGEYYGNTDLQGAPLVVRNDTAINFNWGLGSPDPAVPIDNFSARWTRTLDFASGTYRFTVQTDDGVRVFVDNNLIIDQWHSATLQTYTADVNLTAGSHALRVEYYEGILNAYIVFTFQLGS